MQVTSFFQPSQPNPTKHHRASRSVESLYNASRQGALELRLKIVLSERSRQMCRLLTLLAALLLPTAPSLLAGTALSTASLMVSQSQAQSLSAEPVVKIGQAITVRIEGATQGSGSLIKRDGNRYTVLTAWHVVSEQRQGEELVVLTNDGKSHYVEFADIKRVGGSDSALLSFESNNAYEVARLASRVKLPVMAYVAGHPMGNDSEPWVGKFVILGQAKCQAQYNEGDLLYQRYGTSKGQNSVSSDGDDRIVLNKETDTRIGVSGGPVLLENGSLIGHHNAGLGVGNGVGVSIKMGLNRGSTIRVIDLAVENTYNDEAICSLIDSYEASASGNYSDALELALRAYDLDRSIFGALHDTLLTAAMQTGRVQDILCPIHARGNNIALTGIENICRTAFTPRSSVERVWDWGSDFEKPYLCGEEELFTERNKRTWYLCAAYTTSASNPRYQSRWVQLSRKDGIHRPLLIFYELPRTNICKGGDVTVQVGYATESNLLTPLNSQLLGVTKVSPEVHASFAPMINSIAPGLYRKSCLEAGLNPTWSSIKTEVVEADQLYELGFLKSPWASKFKTGPKRGQTMF